MGSQRFVVSKQLVTNSNAVPRVLMTAVSKEFRLLPARGRREESSRGRNVFKNDRNKSLPPPVSSGGGVVDHLVQSDQAKAQKAPRDVQVRCIDRQLPAVSGREEQSRGE